MLIFKNLKYFVGEIAELKTGFKHEVHFNKLTENIKSETLTWAVVSFLT